MLNALMADPTATPWPAVMLRLAAACLLGGAIGLEREWHRKPAGLRTHILVAVGRLPVLPPDLRDHGRRRRRWAAPPPGPTRSG